MGHRESVTWKREVAEIVAEDSMAEGMYGEWSRLSRRARNISELRVLSFQSTGPSFSQSDSSAKMAQLELGASREPE